jgi:hypothetical protein
MGKQKNRLTTTEPQNHIAQVTYPVPTLDPKHPARPQHYPICSIQPAYPVPTAGYIDLLTLYLPWDHPDLPVHLAVEIKPAYPAPRPPKSPQVEAAYPAAAKNGQPCAHLRSSLPYTRPPPAQVGPRAST